MSDIFISYASQDRARILPLVEALEARGWSVFWDTTVLPGEEWHRKITTELDAARCVIVLWSQTSVDSHWVHEEAGEARRRRILVPALIDPVTIPLGFRSLQAANLIGWDGAADHRELEKMLRAIEIHAPLAKAAVLEKAGESAEHRETLKAAVEAGMQAYREAMQDLRAAAAAGGVIQPVRPAPTPKEDNLVTIPAGTFWMGAQKTDKNDRNYDSEALDDEYPVHQVTLKSFRIARFPVTVAEFAAFIDSGGYSERKFWGAGGLGTADQPGNWADQKKNPPWPVVGVSWFEASAYCAWAGLRLPTEAEWERVARGPESSRYPWGYHPPLDQSRANYKSKIGHPSPQGQSLNGRSVEGVDDLLGNVWEWCVRTLLRR